MTTKDEALELALDALEKHGAVPLDWACAECRPNSDMLKIGFQCRYHSAITAIKQAQTEVMVNTTPPATARDKWMYEQGRLAERDPRTHAIKQAQQAQEPHASEAVTWTPETGYVFAAPKALAPELVNCDTCVYHYKEADQKPCNTCVHARDFYDNFEPRVAKGTP